MIGIPANYLISRYEGMFIPKGATVVLNEWGLHFNDEIFPDPWRYNPQRYLGKRGAKTAFEALNTARPEDRDHWGYGAGRRWCPGTLHLKLI
jgi:cytochrome P450